jgi:hypothetical protein
MARLAALLTVAAAACSLAASDASAGTVRIYNPGTDYRQATSVGGEFRVDPQAGYSGEEDGLGIGVPVFGTIFGFESFCLERQETFFPGSLYESVVSDRAILGGNGGPFDLLDGRSAWLYEQFRAGTLPGYDFTPGPGRAASSADLQMAFWFIEQELGATSNAFVTLANTQAVLAGYVTANPDGSFTTLSIGNVRVLQIWDVGFVGDPIGHVHQDMLTLIPLPPAAWAGLASLGGVMILGYVRRRKNLREIA